MAHVVAAGQLCSSGWRGHTTPSLLKVEASSGLGSLSSPSVETERTGLQGDSFLLCESHLSAVFGARCWLPLGRLSFQGCRVTDSLWVYKVTPQRRGVHSVTWPTTCVSDFWVPLRHPVGIGTDRKC